MTDRTHAVLGGPSRHVSPSQIQTCSAETLSAERCACRMTGPGRRYDGPARHGSTGLRWTWRGSVVPPILSFGFVERRSEEGQCDACGSPMLVGTAAYAWATRLFCSWNCAARARSAAALPTVDPPTSPEEGP